MRLQNIFILIFLLAAFTIGVSLAEQDRTIVDGAINNVTEVIENISLQSSEESSIPNMDGLFIVLEKYIKFIVAFVLEIFRAGIYFGQDNPDYFEPTFIIKIIKLLVWLAIISLLIKPIGYLIIIIIMSVLTLKEIINKRKKVKNEKPKT